MTRYSEDEVIFLELVSDFALSASRMLLSKKYISDTNEHIDYDDDMTISLLHEYFEQVYEQRADVGTNYCTNKVSLSRYLTMILTDEFMSKLEVGNDYSTGFQVIMTIVSIVRHHQSNDVISFMYTDNVEEGEHRLTRADVMMNYEELLKTDIFKYYPLLYKAVK